MVERGKVVQIDRIGQSTQDRLQRAAELNVLSTPATRLSDGVNLALMAVGIVILLRVVKNPATGQWTAATALILCGLALGVAWQVVRRNWLPAQMPRRWIAGERRVQWLHTAHTCIAVAGAVGYFAFVCLWISSHQLVPRTVFPVIVFGYLVVQAVLTGFFRDHQPVSASPRNPRRTSLFHTMQPIRSERWGDPSL